MANVYNVLDELIACRGVNNVAMFMDETQAQGIADDLLFDNSFAPARMGMTFKELYEHFKTYSD